MPSDNADLMKLYSARILALAADMPLMERLEAPQATVRKRAPLCGSTITVDLNCEGGRITQFGQDVKACALGQAAASVVAANIVGRTRADVAKAQMQMHAMLKDGGPVPEAPFSGLEVLQPAAEYRNRHASIMLALDATLEAMDEAGCT